MVNNDFWNLCTKDSIREDIAKFIDSTPALSHLKGIAYYEFEDALVEFLQNVKEKIYRECDREYHREDVVNHIADSIGEPAGQIVASALPFAVIDKIVGKWSERLEDYTPYWDCVWETLSSTLEEDFIPFDGDLTEKEAWVYAAYLDDWYSSHPDSLNMHPVSIGEFFDNEMTDEKTKKYYTSCAERYKKKFE